MKFLYITSTLLSASLAGCGTLSVPGTPETAPSLNGFRASHGLSQLRTDGALAALASEHAADMARRDNLDHNGFMSHRAPRGARAENVAYGCKETTCVIQQWVMNCPGIARKHADPKPYPVRPRLGHFAVGQEVLDAVGGRLAAHGYPSERKLAHRMSAPVKVLGVVRPQHPPGIIVRKEPISEREVQHPALAQATRCHPFCARFTVCHNLTESSWL